MQTVEMQIGRTRIIGHLPDDMEAALVNYAARISKVLGRTVTVISEAEAAAMAEAAETVGREG